MLDEGEIFDSGMLRQEIAALVQQGNRNIALDFSLLTYLYSDAMNAIFALNRQVLDVNGRLAVLMPTEEVSQILQAAGIYNFIKVYHTVEELVRSSEDIIMQTSSFDASALRTAAAPKSEFEDLRAEIGSALEGRAAVPQRPAAPRPPMARPQPPRVEARAQRPPMPPPAQPMFEEPAPPPRPARPPVAAPGALDMEPAVDRGRRVPPMEEEEAEEKKKSPALAIAIVVILVIAALGAGAYFLLPGLMAPKAVPQTTTTAAPKPAETPPPAPAPAAPETTAAAAQAAPATTAPAPATPAPTPAAAAPEPAKPAVAAPTKKPEPAAKPAAKPRDVFATKKATPPAREAKPVAAAKPAAAPPPPPPQVSRLTITSTPSGAKVNVDGVDLGTTPFTWNNPEATGSVSITVSKAGYLPSTETIEYNGGIKSKAFKLAKEPPPPPPPKAEPAPAPAAAAPPPPPEPEPAPAPAPAPVASGESGKAATVFISSIPPVADVYMDGKLIGKTNISKLNVQSGTHSMKFVKGAKEHTVDMSFQPGDNPAKHVSF